MQELSSLGRELVDFLARTVLLLPRASDLVDCHPVGVAVHRLGKVEALDAVELCFRLCVEKLGFDLR